MRSILEFVRRAIAAVATFTFVFVRLSGETVGRWIRVLQPAAPAAVDEPARTVDEMLPQPAPKPAGLDESYEAIRQVAAALIVGKDPTPAQLATIADMDVKEWLWLLNDRELQLVSQLSPTTLRAHLTGRLRAPGLLRLSTAEMLDREHELGWPKRNEIDDDFEQGLVLAS